MAVICTSGGQIASLRHRRKKVFAGFIPQFYKWNFNTVRNTWYSWIDDTSNGNSPSGQIYPILDDVPVSSNFQPEIDVDTQQEEFCHSMIPSLSIRWERTFESGTLSNGNPYETYGVTGYIQQVGVQGQPSFEGDKPWTRYKFYWKPYVAVKKFVVEEDPNNPNVYITTEETIVTASGDRFFEQTSVALAHDEVTVEIPVDEYIWRDPNDHSLGYSKWTYYQNISYNEIVDTLPIVGPIDVVVRLKPPYYA